MTVATSKVLPLFVVLALAVAGNARAACPPSCPITGGGDEATDCHSEFASNAMRLNFPFFNPAKIKPAKEHRCLDGDAGCDLDGTVNNVCVFDIDICLRNEDPNLSSCTATDVQEVAIKGNTTKFPELQALQDAANALLPAATNVCTDGQTLTVPLKGPSGKGEFKRSKGKVKLITKAGSDTDKDQLRLSCVPHNWPAHGYNWRNQRSTPVETKITPANASQLEFKWSFTTTSAPVTSTPTVDRKQVYVSSWDGKVYALQAKSGKVKWEFDTGSGDKLGIQSSVTLTPEGRVVVGDSFGKVYCLTAKKGELLWQADVGDTDPEGSHIWASPTVANGRVFVGRGGADPLCTQGHLYAFDLDTGAELWRYKSLPDGVCFDDTTVECSDDSECGGTGSFCHVNFCEIDISQSCATNSDCPASFVGTGESRCVTSLECAFDVGTSCATNADCPSCVATEGAAITATPAVDATGETVYVSTVDCFDYPSVGNSNAIIALDAETGAELWATRGQAIEQFADPPAPTIYHDYGFLNGPIVAEIDDGLGGTQTVAVAGGKEGVLYAVDAATGALVWSNELSTPLPTFAGFGLFNGAIAFADGNFYAALSALFASPGTWWPSTNDHLYSFFGDDGNTAWSDQIGAGFADTTVANGVLFTGGSAFGDLEYFAYDAQTGARLTELFVPNNVAGGAAIVNGTVYVPYGAFGGDGGVIAFGLPK